VLAVEPEPVPLGALLSALGPRVGRAVALEAVEALRRRSLLERAETGDPAAFTLQSVVLEYVKAPAYARCGRSAVTSAWTSQVLPESQTPSAPRCWPWAPSKNPGSALTDPLDQLVANRSLGKSSITQPTVPCPKGAWNSAHITSPMTNRAVRPVADRPDVEHWLR